MKRSIFFSAIGTVLLASCGSGNNEQDTTMLADHRRMMAEDSTELAMHQAREEGLRAVFKMFETGNAEGAEQYMTDNYVEHTPPPGTQPQGIQGFKEMVAMMGKGWSDNKMSIISVAHAGDTMFVHYRWKGRNTGEMMPGMPATGKEVDATGVDVVVYDGTKAIGHWGYFEEMKMMSQLGLMSDSAAATAAAPEKKK
jgi:predicted ester cyclase